MRVTTDVVSKDIQDELNSSNRRNRGQFEEGSERAREMGRLGGLKRSGKQKKEKIPNY